MIHAKNISKSFGKQRLFSNLNICLEKGSFLIVHGSNGAGKSTLLKTLIRVISSDTGTQDYLSNLSRDLSLGYVSTNTNSFFNRLSVLDNLTFFLQMRGFNKEQSIKKIKDIFKELQIHTGMLDQKYMFLSSGERKKVLLIRCFAHQPYLIVMDEPMSSLDKQFKELFLRYLSNICKNKNHILIIVSHNIDLYKDLYTHELDMDNHLNCEIKTRNQFR
jgi:ABC-type multidrug transport system ATPase subunit